MTEPSELTPAAKAICDGCGTTIGAGLQQMADAMRGFADPHDCPAPVPGGGHREDCCHLQGPHENHISGTTEFREISGSDEKR
jgi:hypothetical protein